MSYIYPENLINFLENLTIEQKEEICDRSFYHPNNFYKVVLKNDNGLMTRLHLWKKGYEDQYHHNHSWSFKSYVLYGKLLDHHYEEIPNENGYLMKYSNSQSNGIYKYSPLYRCDMISKEIIERTGIYSISSKVIHKALPVVDNTITLLHQGEYEGFNDIYSAYEYPTCDYKKLTITELDNIMEICFSLLKR